MTFDFKGRRVVVCGGSRGIGRAIAHGFAKAGADVSVCARGAAGLEAVRAELAAHGGKVHVAPCDLADGAAIAAYIPAAAQALGGIDVLVNNASGFGTGTDDASWEVGFAVDVMAIVRASRAAEPFLKAATGGSIVNVSSISGLRPTRRGPAYAAVKATAIQYTGTQAAMLARDGVRVNCVAPGSIEFPGGTWEKRREADPALYERIHASIPFGRLGHPEEVADVVLFLASPAARWVSGQTIAVDGGQMLGA